MAFRSAFLTAALLASSLAWCAAASLAASLGEIKSRGEIIIGVKDEAPPFGYRNEAGELIGLEIDLAKDIAARLGVAMKPFVVSASSRLQFLELKEIDLVVATLAVTPYRERAAKLIMPYYYASAPALLAARDSQIKSASDLDRKSVCVLMKAFYSEALTSAAPKAERVPFRRFREAANAYKEGRCIALAGQDTQLIRLREESGERKSDSLIPLDGSERPWAIAVRPGEEDDDLAAFLSETVTDWHKSGKLVALEKKWLGRNTPWVIEMHEKLR